MTQKYFSSKNLYFVAPTRVWVTAIFHTLFCCQFTVLLMFLDQSPRFSD